MQIVDSQKIFKNETSATEAENNQEQKSTSEEKPKTKRNKQKADLKEIGKNWTKFLNSKDYQFMNFNLAIVAGRLTRDPEIRSLPSGQTVTSFSLATSRFYKDQNGQQQEKTEFHNIVAFGKLGEIASSYLRKGSLALIQGHLQTRNWQDASGNKKYRTEIIADNLQLGPRSQELQSPSLTPYEQPKTPQQQSKTIAEPEIPIIEENDDIDVKDIPF